MESLIVDLVQFSCGIDRIDILERRLGARHAEMQL